MDQFALVPDPILHDLVPPHCVLQFRQSLLKTILHQLLLQFLKVIQVDPQQPTLLHNSCLLQGQRPFPKLPHIEKHFFKQCFSGFANFMHVVLADEFDFTIEHNIKERVGYFSLK